MTFVDGQLVPIDTVSTRINSRSSRKVVGPDNEFATIWIPACLSRVGCHDGVTR